jgi:hypothetical protein
MLTRLPNGDVEMTIRPPLIYLDHWAVREISSSPRRRDHFLETFRTRGTLMFSLLNIVEISRNKGESYKQMRELLDGIGRFWLLSESDPGTVQQRTAVGMPPPASFLGDLRVLANVFTRLPLGTYKLGTAFDDLQDESVRGWADKMVIRPSVVALLRYRRWRHKWGDRDVPNPHSPGSPMWIQHELLWYLIKDGKNITDNDVIDIMHASVALWIAPIVLLDSAWVNFSRKLKLPGVQLFAKPELDAALSAMRTLDVSPAG